MPDATATDDQFPAVRLGESCKGNNPYWDVFKNTHSAIIDPETWEMAQRCKRVFTESAAQIASIFALRFDPEHVHLLRLKRFQRIFARYDKLDMVFSGFVFLSWLLML